MTTTAHLSDRAHRVLFQLALRRGDGWVDVASICAGLGLNSHQVRRAITELHTAGMAERKRCILRDAGGRRVKHTYFRLIDTTSEARA
ncbi:hypothetical protein [Streptomyces similanensis]|uniref:Helix-turn-helix domain-containing protein n=1 Tax=Streptomyces similanensis TaxID=1274988 RepID=A0ABP9L3K3_9ACTN